MLPTSQGNTDRTTDRTHADSALPRPACVQVQYRITGDPRDYQRLAAATAPQLARLPGLCWKLWLFDPLSGDAAGIYLFSDAAAAAAFLAGPTLSGLRQHPAIAGVSARCLGVLTDLSLTTFGARAGL
jgi:Putative mono-oxygenase ydhR